MVNNFQQVYNALPQGWLYNYRLNPQSEPKHAFIAKKTLHAPARQGFTMKLAHKCVLDSEYLECIAPTKVSKGIDRMRLAPPPEVDVYDGVNVINLILRPKSQIEYNKDAGKMEPTENNGYVLIVHMVESLDVAYFEKWKNDLTSPNRLHAEIIGMAWIKADPNDPDLPEEFYSRYNEFL